MTQRTIFCAAALTLMLPGLAAAGGFTIDSKNFADGTFQPAQYADVFGCSGGNVSPEIRWSGAPPETKSFMVTVYDKDAPTGSGWWHWVVIDIPPSTDRLDEGAAAGKLPKGAQTLKGDAGAATFLGACPPEGTKHDYIVTVKALGIDRLPIPGDATPALAGFVSNMNVLATATLTATAAR